MTTAAASTPSLTESKAYAELLSKLREAATLGSIGSLLGWDQETMMPPGAVEFRSQQMALVSTLAHQRATDPRLGELIAECEADSSLMDDASTAANIHEIRRQFDRETKLPTDLVAEMSETSSRAMHIWKDAREKSDFAMFQPWLEKQVELNRRKAECYGAPKGGELYDALVEDYEPGSSAAIMETIFKPLREALAPLIAEVRDKAKQFETTPAELAAPIEQQRRFVRFLAQRVGYDFDRGRIDLSTHPFSESVGVGDNRITTRFDEHNFADAVATTLHESGHAMYEQGLPEDKFGQPLGEYISLGIHESQSRMWENQVGRSRAFWAWALPEAQRAFGGPLTSFSLDDMVRAINTVRPHFIRVESDEATYNLHIMLRFDIERALISGDLAVADLPGVWNERMKSDLGLDVPDDRRGCLQDIHWSMGSIGYFGTYTLGNLYAAQMWERIGADLPSLESSFERGEFGDLLTWLRTNVHAHGRRYKAGKLCQRLTDAPLSHEPLVRYLDAKLRRIYGL